MEVHAAALPLNLVDLAFAVVLATGLEGEQLGVLGKPLQGSYLLLKKGWSTAMGGLSAALGSRPAVVHAATTVIRCRL